MALLTSDSATEMVVFATALLMMSMNGTAPQIHAMELTIDADADAFISSDDWADRNAVSSFGFSLRAVGQQNDFTGNQIGRQLYKFVVPVSVNTADIASAQLKLKTYENYAGFPYQTAVYGVADIWSELTVTWNTQPLTDSDELDSLSIGCCGIVYDYDVTDYVIAQLNGGDQTISFQQRGQDESVVGGLRWWQRESDGMTLNGIAGHIPQLILFVVPEPTTSALALAALCLAMSRRRAF